MTSLTIWINLFLIASSSQAQRNAHTSQGNMTGVRGSTSVARDHSKHHPSTAEVTAGAADRMASVEHLIARKLDQGGVFDEYSICSN